MCFLCDKSFSKSWTLHSHIKNVHDGRKTDNGYPCNDCGIYFAQKSALTKHLNLHSQSKIVCDMCGSQFPDKRSVLLHFTSHIPDMVKIIQETHTCNFCGLLYTSSKNLNRHIKTIHDPSTLFQCDYCVLVFSRSDRLKSHLQRCPARKNAENLKQEPGAPKIIDLEFIKTEVLTENQGQELEREDVIKEEIKDGSDHDFEPFDWQSESMGCDDYKLTMKFEPNEIGISYPDNLCPQAEVTENSEAKLAEDALGKIEKTFGGKPVDTFQRKTSKRKIPEKSVEIQGNSMEFSVNTPVVQELSANPSFSETEKKPKNPLYLNIKNHWCPHCTKCFSRTNQLRDHIDFVHKNLLKFKCEICEKSFGHHRSLKRHLLGVHMNDKKMKCNMCIKEFKSIVGFKKHQKMCLLGTKCSVCFREFATAHARNQHYLTSHAKEKCYKCDYCGRDFSKKNNLATHIRCVHFKTKVSILKCSICQESFSNEYQLKKHRIQVHDKGKIVTRSCGLCCQTFQLYEDFKKHIEQHDNYLICMVCGFCSLNFEEFKVHEKTHKKLDTHRVVCDVCGVSLAHKHSLAVHMRMHLNIHPYVCDLCGKKFKYATSFQMHKVTHDDTKHFECKICQKFYTTRQSLQLHLRIHSSERMYNCDFCEKTFKIKQSRDLHMRRHTGQFKCSQCGRNCSSKQSLECHELQHSGLRPFSCMFCQKTYTFGKNLKMHIRKNHMDQLEATNFLDSVK